MKLKYSIGFLTICLMFLSSCSSTRVPARARHVPDGEFLLGRTQVERDKLGLFDFLRSEEKKRRTRNFSESHLSRNDFIPLQRQAPNNRILFVPLRLMMYNSINPEKNNRWTKLMQRMGEPPVIFDSLYADQSVQRMRQFLVNNGHFNSTVYYTAETTRPKFKRLMFHVNTGPGYHYRNVSLDVRDDSLVNMFNDWSSQTLINTGDPYNVEILDAERLRVMRQLQNHGFFSFRRDNIEFLIDSALNARLMDVTMIVNPPGVGEHSQKYTFDDVYIFPDERPGQPEIIFDTTIYRLPKSRRDTATHNFHFIHTKPLQVKPHAVATKLLIRPGEFYSLSNVSRTYENLLDLRVFRSTNVNIHPILMDSNDPKRLLLTTIEIPQALRWSVETSFDVSTTSGLQGSSATVALQNRNLFGGAEIFSLQLRGLIELQQLLDPARRRESELDLVNNFDLGLSANLDIPRFITPFNLSQMSVHRPRTLISVGYRHQFRPLFYNQQVLSTSLAYSWRQTNSSHILTPLDISSVKIALTDTFQHRINILSENNRRLEERYRNHFIFASRYSYFYSGQQSNRPISFNAFRFSVETAGNLLSLVSRMTDAPRNDSGQYLIFNLPFAQYVRVNADLKRYWFLTDNQVLVTRLMGGSGFAYGNANVLPYEKGFFAGGNNNIRAWPMNQLGPGSYRRDPDQPNIERVGDIVLVGNIEYRFPIPFLGALKGALFVDAGNIWLYNDNQSFPNGEFFWKNVPNDLAVGGGFGLRWDFGFFVIRLDAAAPLRNPANPNNEKWVISKLQPKDFVLNFGIGYPF